MATKLTLSLDSKVIDQAKRYAEKKGVSLSKLVEEYFNKITTPHIAKRRKAIDELKGVLGRVPEDFNNKKAKKEYLFEKYMKK
jgi:hypothetical protein